MREMKHTPGPWSIIAALPHDGDDDAFDGAYTSPASIEGADGNPVCMFGSCEGSGTLFENEADYHLIAAAPDLLATLLAMDRFWTEDFPEGPEQAAARRLFDDQTISIWRRIRAAISKASPNLPSASQEGETNG